MSEWLKNNKMYVLMGMIIIIMLGIYIFLPLEKDAGQQMSDMDLLKQTQLEKEKTELAIGERTEENKENEAEKIWIDIKGAVHSPGVYEVSPGDRVIDAIKAAGGLLEQADQNNVNFAMKVVDEMVLYIPTVGEITGILETVTTPHEENGKVNINTATDAELQTLPGIGKSKAAAIMEYRDQKGPFGKIEDIMEISGIGVKTFEKLKEHIIVK